jgi:hypothetical protein
MLGGCVVGTCCRTFAVRVSKRGTFSYFSGDQCALPPALLQSPEVVGMPTADERNKMQAEGVPIPQRIYNEKVGRTWLSWQGAGCVETPGWPECADRGISSMWWWGWAFGRGCQGDCVHDRHQRQSMWGELCVLRVCRVPCAGVLAVGPAGYDR